MRNIKTQTCILICIYLISGVSVTLAQQGKALITDIRHVQKTKFNNDLKGYFEQDDDFRNMVFGIIEDLTREKFDVSVVEYQERDKIKYVDYGLPGKLNIKNIDPGSVDIFVSITSSGFLWAQIGNNLTYRLKTEVLVKNKKGKNIFKQKNVQDFNSIKGDYLFGENIIGHEDFLKLYEQGLTAAFSSEKTDFELQTVRHPVSTKYYEFINTDKKWSFAVP